jgi:ATP-dependent DNA helicase RecQ
MYLALHGGHDFRPSYLGLKDLRDVFGGVPFQALTATATLEVQETITKSLGMTSPVIVKSSLNRPNLAYEVRRKAGPGRYCSPPHPTHCEQICLELDGIL